VEARVAVLEEVVRKIDMKLDRIGSTPSSIGSSFMELRPVSAA
jgi:hypothetical protein